MELRAFTFLAFAAATVLFNFARGPIAVPSFQSQ